MNEKKKMSAELSKTGGRSSKYKSMDAATTAAQTRLRDRIKVLEGNISTSR